MNNNTCKLYVLVLECESLFLRGTLCSVEMQLQHSLLHPAPCIWNYKHGEFVLLAGLCDLMLYSTSGMLASCLLYS